MNLYYQSQGSGQPLIILHGLFGSSDNWRGLAKKLAVDVQVISVDLRNHGKSPHSEKISYDEMASDVIKLIKDLGLSKVDVIGHSIGGKVAMAMAASNAEKIRRLAIVDMAPKLYLDNHGDIFEALLALNLSQFNKRSEADEVLAITIKDKSIRQFLLMNLTVIDGRIQWRINLQGLSDNYSQLLEPVCQGLLIDKPTLFLKAGLSNYIGQADEVMIKEIFINVDITTINQAGHWIHAEFPSLFLTKVNDFFGYDK